MKKFLPLFLAICFFTQQSKGQLPYASIWSGYPTTYQLSAGFATNVMPGYFWLGYMSSVQNIQTTWHLNKNFCIMGSGTSALWASYKVFDSKGCEGTLQQVLNGNGVSAVETNGIGPASNLRYALAGVYDQACYYTGLDKFGNVLSAISYPFPYTPSGEYKSPSKPIIVESVKPNEFFICGSFEADMYILNIDATGTIIWSSFYKLGNTVSPKDIMVNPYDTEKLIVIGTTEEATGDRQGFFMEVGASSGNVSQANLYGGMNDHDEFNCVTAGANINSSNGNGFVIGGSSKRGHGVGSPWIIKLDPSGNIIWSRFINQTVGISKGIIDVVERLNTLNNYEYYALSSCSAGMQVFKLDDQGLPFPLSSPNALHNEFIYDLPAMLPSKPTSISYVDGLGTNPDVGIQIFGTATNMLNFTSSYVVSAYFNGETNCFRTLTTISGSSVGPLEINIVPVARYGTFAPCTNFQVQAFFPGGSINYPCFGLMANGNNQRTVAPGITGQVDLNEDFSVSPNPVINKTVVNYTADDNSEVKIELFDLLGRHIAAIQPQAKLAGTYQEEIDFGSLDIREGVYYLETTVDGTVHKQKIIYSK